MKKYIAIAVLMLGATLASAQSLRFDGIKHGEFQFSKLTDHHTALHILAVCSNAGTNITTEHADKWESGCAALGEIGQRYFDEDEDFKPHTYLMFSNSLDITIKRGTYTETSYFTITDAYETPCTGKGFAEVCK